MNFICGWYGTINASHMCKVCEVFPLYCLFQANLDEATDNWGIKVERVEIKDVKLPHQLQRAMAAEAEATREARAKVRTCNVTHAVHA